MILVHGLVYDIDTVNLTKKSVMVPPPLLSSYLLNIEEECILDFNIQRSVFLLLYVLHVLDMSLYRCLNETFM